MTSKEEAKELVCDLIYQGEKPHVCTIMNQQTAKMCALICVKKIINSLKPYWKNWDEGHAQAEFEYWEEVKQEINKL